MKTKTRWFASIVLLALLSASTARAANILWVSLAPPLGFSGPGTSSSGYTDQGFVMLLQNAGHNVNRFHPAESQNTLLTQQEIDAMNTNDLVIIARCAGSGAWQAPQGLQWNTNVTKPLMCMSPYLVRTLAGTGNRMGWFTGDVGPDDTPTVVSAVDVASAATDYLLAGVDTLGTNTVKVYDESLDRNTSQMLFPPVAGGRTLLSATFAREDNGTIATSSVVADFPAGTMATLGPAPLAGYRMYFAGGSREGATAPNPIPLYTGRETLTAVGEDIFLRAVQLALNSGVPPATDPNAPMGVTSQSTSMTVLQGQAATFSISVTGAAPRTLQWQRDSGDGMTFTNIPDASTPFLKSSYTLPAVTLTDNGAAFRVVAQNAINSVTSDVVVVTVSPDIAAPAPLSAASVNGMTVGVCFDELLDTAEGTAVDPFNYAISGGGGVTDAILRPDGRSVLLTLSAPVGSTFELTVSGVKDWLGNAMPAPVTLMGTNFGLTAIDVGAVSPAGAEFSCSAQSFEVDGGGLDMTSTTDQLRFLYQSVDGDFDARVRVVSLTGSQRLESVAKAALTARETTDTGSAAVNVFATPPAPGNDWISSNYRPSSGAATNVMGPTVMPNRMPNAWLRITRAGNLFTTFHSGDGNTWTEIGSTTLALASSLQVGVGVVSHRNTFLATGTFSDLRIGSLVSQPMLINASYSAGSFSAAFQSQNGLNYTVQYKDAIDAPMWSTLTMIAGDGTLKTFTDPGPVSPTGNRFYRLSSP